MIKIKFRIFLQSTTHPMKIDIGLHFGGFGPDCIFIGRAIDAALVSFDIALVSLGFALVWLWFRASPKACMYPIVGTRVRNRRYARTQWSVRARGIVFTRVNMVWVSEISIAKISSFFVKFGFLYRKFIRNLKIPKIRCWNFSPRNSEFPTSKLRISRIEIPNFQDRNQSIIFLWKSMLGGFWKAWDRIGFASGTYRCNIKRIWGRIRFLRRAMPSM